MKKAVRFAEKTKVFDGSSKETYDNYKVLASILGRKIFNIKKKGIEEREIEELKLRYNKTQKKIYPQILQPFSLYIKKAIKENVCNKESFETLNDINCVEDCINYCNNSIEQIDSIIFDLEDAISNIIYIRENEDINNCIEKDSRCEREDCDSSCAECVFLRKVYLKNSLRKVSLIRKGSRDYSLSVPVNFNFEMYLRSVKELLKDSRDVIEERYFLSFLKNE